MGKANGRKTIFITGAASGIGAETARYFAGRGWFTGLYDIDEAGLAEVAGEIGTDNCTSGTLDVCDRAQWADAIAGFSDTTGGQMHALFNNAGIARHGWFEDIPPEDSDLVVDVNVKGVINGVYASLPLLKATPGGRIINVASVAGFVAAPQLAVYAATKFAVRGLTEALDVELQGTGVSAATLAPWFVDTPILDAGATEGANQKMSDQLNDQGLTVYPVNMAAERAWEAVQGDELHYTVGGMAKRSRFISRLFPGMMRRQLQKSLPPRD